MVIDQSRDCNNCKLHRQEHIPRGLRCFSELGTELVNLTSEARVVCCADCLENNLYEWTPDD